MSDHTVLHERLIELANRPQPQFEASSDPVLVSFAALFADSDLVAFAADRRLRIDALSPMYDCETLSLRANSAEPERFSVIWTPIFHYEDPLTGFRQGHNSAYLGTTPAVAMPQDERTAALLLLVTSTFVHLSASYVDGAPLVQGAIETDDLEYRFVTLDPAQG